jgi:carbon monoxide dehydrogenase subunit G
MIEAEHGLSINAQIETVWDYVKDIQNWATLFPGCSACDVLNDNDSRWTLKVGAGGMVKTVNVLVHVDKWAGPEAVDFSFKLEKEPVTGSGSFRSSAASNAETAVCMRVQVVGTGAMAPMWEAVSKPLLPQLAKSFAASLKAEIEQIPVVKTSLLARLVQRLQQLFRSLLGRGSTPSREG